MFKKGCIIFNSFYMMHYLSFVNWRINIVSVTLQFLFNVSQDLSINPFDFILFSMSAPTFTKKLVKYITNIIFIFY